MADDLADLLARLTPVAEESHVWGKGGPSPTPLRVRGYLGAELPPIGCVTSARAVVLRGDAVLALRSGSELRLLPGGRREGGETPEQAVRREVLEESGWTLGALSLLGFIHYRDLGPRREPPAGSPYHYSYPDFTNPVYGAEAETYAEGALVPNEYEPEGFTPMPIEEVRAAALGPIARAFLEAALAAR